MAKQDRNQLGAASPEEAGETARLFGERLQQERRAQGATRADLFARCGVSEDYIALVERGRANPTIDTMIKLAEGVGKEAWELIEPPQ